MNQEGSRARQDGAGHSVAGVIGREEALMTTYDQPKRLYRSRSSRLVAGVCGGIAEYFGWDPTLVRLVFLVSLLLPGPQVVFYLAAWIIIPYQPFES
jgi:phage shock protein PspC (stress-responsive transcriptional regulator)